MKLSQAVISLCMLLVLATPVPSVVRLTLAQHQACYYQPFHKHLACQCGQEGSHASYLSIKMMYWVRDMGQEVRMSFLYISYVSSPICHTRPYLEISA